MIKRTIKETIREFDPSGRLIRETVTETAEDDDTMYFPPFTPAPYNPVTTQSPWWSPEPTCTSNVVQ